MAARDMARHVDVSLCILPASNAAWSLAPKTQSFGLSLGHTSMTDLHIEQFYIKIILFKQKFYPFQSKTPSKRKN